MKLALSPEEELAIHRLSEDFIERHHRPYRRYNADNPEFESQMTILLGARGVGKTTLMIQQIRERYPDQPRQRLFLPIDHALFTEMSLYGIVAHFYKQGVKMVCIDEIHKYPSWPKDLKSLKDEFPDLKVMGSGSSAIEIQKSARDLSRRAVVSSMFGLSFREYLELTLDLQFPLLSLEELLKDHENFAKLVLSILKKSAPTTSLFAYFHKYLGVGYYPYHLEYPLESLFKLTLMQSLDVTLEAEIPAQNPHINFATTLKFKRLLGIIATLPPFEFELKKILRLTDIADERTLKAYLRMLETAGLVITMNRGASGLKAMRKPDKIYLDNTNLLNALVPRADTINSGSMRELYFLMSTRVHHKLSLADSGDFTLDKKFTFEIGGANKNMRQIHALKAAHLVKDGIDTGYGNTIPLWIFGFLY